MQRLSRKEIIWLGLALAFVFLLFVLNIPILAWSESKAPDTSAYSPTSNKLHAFPLLDVTQTTIYKPAFPTADGAYPAVARPGQPLSQHGDSERQNGPDADVLAESGLRAWTKEEIQDLIRIHSANVGIDARSVLEIARCESGFRWDSRNRASSAAGVFQYLGGTWANTVAGREGISPLDADANIRMAVSHMAVHGYGAWASSQGCWDT